MKRRKDASVNNVRTDFSLRVHRCQKYSSCLWKKYVWTILRRCIFISYPKKTLYYVCVWRFCFALYMYFLSPKEIYVLIDGENQRVKHTNCNILIKYFILNILSGMQDQRGNRGFSRSTCFVSYNLNMKGGVGSPSCD